MKLIALLAWYDEDPEMLERYVASLTAHGFDHLVAVDGAYSLYPDAKAQSPPEQHAALQGMSATIVAPTEPWRGNEVEKRARLFAEAWKVAEDGDWFLVIDADERIGLAPRDFRERLAALEQEVAVVMVVEKFWNGVERGSPYIRWFRAQEIRPDTNHWTFVRADGECIGGPFHEVTVPAADMTDFAIDHHHMDRSNDRLLKQGDYYRIRDQLGVERRPCVDCGETSMTLMPTGWHQREDGHLVGEMLALCWTCADRREGDDRVWFEEHNRHYSEVPLRGRDGEIRQGSGRLVVLDDRQ